MDGSVTIAEALGHVFGRALGTIKETIKDPGSGITNITLFGGKLVGQCAMSMAATHKEFKTIKGLRQTRREQQQAKRAEQERKEKAKEFLRKHQEREQTPGTDPGDARVGQPAPAQNIGGPLPSTP